MNTIIFLFCLLLASTIQAAKLDNSILEHYLCRTKQNGFRSLVPGSCTQYYECQNGKSLLRSCSRYYDSESRLCVNTNPGCVETVEAKVSVPAGCSGPCCGISNGDYVLEPSNSKIYYKCQDNCVISTNTCAGDLMFDLVKEECASPIICGNNGESCTTATAQQPCTTAPGTTTSCTTTTCTTAPGTTTSCTTTTCTTAPGTTTSCTTTTCTTTTCPTTTCITTTCTTTPCAVTTSSSTPCTTTTCATTPCNTTTCTTTTATPSTITITTTTCTTPSEKTPTTCLTTPKQPITPCTITPEETTTPCITTPKQPITPCTTTPKEIQTPCIATTTQTLCTTTKNPCTTTPCITTTKAPCTCNNNVAVLSAPLDDSTSHLKPSDNLQSNIDIYMRFACHNKSNGFILASLKSCNEYFICRYGQALPVSCGDKYFNALKGICDLPENTNCIHNQPYIQYN